MILDTNQLSDLIVEPSFILGKATRTTGLLHEGELVASFDGIRTALDFINENMHEPRNSGESQKGGHHGGNEFSTYKKAMDVFIKDPQMVVRYDPTELQPFEWEEQGNQLEYDVTGDFVDIGRVLEGVPENMGSLHNGNPRSRRVRLVVGTMQAHYMKPDEINHRSERIIRLIDALENARIRTEFITIDTNYCSHVEIIVKRFDEALTIEDVAVATHSDFFRRMGFRIMEYSDTWNGHYGISTVMQGNLDTLKSQMNDELTVYIGNNMRMSEIDPAFDKLETMVTEELSHPVPRRSLMYLQGSRYDERDIS